MDTAKSTVNTFMMSEPVFRWMLPGWALIALAVFFVLLLIPAPYGRHLRSGWGPRVPSGFNWFIMELPALVVFALVFVQSLPHSKITWWYCMLWSLHYGYRSLVYPWFVRGSRSMPVTLTLGGIAYNSVNGFLQSMSVCYFGPHLHGHVWTVDAAMIGGCVFFFTGFVIHIHADMQLQQLRKLHGPEYHLPHGGLYRLISCPNYFGEVIEWIGWAMLTWSPAGLVFALWTAANLVPRALTSHKWYRERFADYPQDRKAIVPFLL